MSKKKKWYERETSFYYAIEYPHDGVENQWFIYCFDWWYERDSWIEEPDEYGLRREHRSRIDARLKCVRKAKRIALSRGNGLYQETYGKKHLCPWRWRIGV